MEKPREYRKHLDTLIALICYLSTTKLISRTPTGIANSLGLEKENVIFVLENFKGLFRKSRRPSPQLSENFFTLHMRYGLRSQKTLSDDGVEGNSQDHARHPLSGEMITTLLNFVIKMAEQENSQDMAAKAIRSTTKSAWIATIAAIIAAFVALLK